MSKGFLSMFGDISDDELKRISEQYEKQCKNLYEFQHRPAPQSHENGLKRAPKIKSATFTCKSF